MRRVIATVMTGSPLEIIPTAVPDMIVSAGPDFDLSAMVITDFAPDPV